jgi:hypothetical protein
MLYVDIPTRPEFKALNDVWTDACVSIYLKTTPVTQATDASRIELGNLTKQARAQLEAVGFDKRRLASLMEHFDDLAEDGPFWRLQADSLAIFATPDRLLTFRLPNSISPMVAVSDRFHLKPLLRAITFSNSAFVLALSENAVRLVEIHAELPAVAVTVDGLPKDAANALGKATLNDRSPNGRIQGAEGQNIRLRQFARQVDAALRPVLSGRETPLILAATGRLASVYRAINSYPNLLPDGIEDSPDRISDNDLADAARPMLDVAHASELGALRALYAEHVGDGRATSDLSDAARAATYGAIETLLVDMDAVVPGTVDVQSGAITFAKAADATNYGVVDEIASRALATGARILAVRKADLPGSGDLAAILRYAI